MTEARDGKIEVGSRTIEMQQEKMYEPPVKIGAVILAAGLSQRMGQPKQLLPLKGKALFLYAVDLALAAGLAPILLVVGEHEQLMRQHVGERQGVMLLRNEQVQGGMGSSLKLGMRMMAEQEVDATFVLLADQPFVPLTVLSQLKVSYLQERRAGYLIFRPSYQGELGHPLLFDSALFPQFEQLRGDRGGKAIVAKYIQLLKVIPFDQKVWNWDIDTPEDYARVLNQDINF